MDKLVGIIRARYAAEPVPPCCVCGSAMGIQKAGGGAATVWGCNNFGQDWEHYEKSRWTQNRPGDLDVIEAADRIESQAAEIEALKHDLARSMETANAYLNERESLTRRVAELEGALEPFASKADKREAYVRKTHPRYTEPDSRQITHRLGDFRRARATLQGDGQ